MKKKGEIEEYCSNESKTYESGNTPSCSFKCGLDDTVLATISIEESPNDDVPSCYTLYIKRTDNVPDDVENHCYCCLTCVEDLLVFLCRYCLNNFIVIGEKEIKYDETTSSYFPPIDESKIPYDLIKYFDIPRQERGDEEDESI